MQDRYAGDMGDFGKFLLLRQLENAGMQLGINWYFTLPIASEKDTNGTFKQNDGRHRIPDKLIPADPDLAYTLRAIHDGQPDRSVKALENARLISNARYFGEPVPADILERNTWFRTSLNQLAGCDSVFLDPDNGLLPKSIQKGAPKSVKYALPQEVHGYLNAGFSVILYSHRPRKKALEYLKGITSILAMQGIDTSPIQSITFPRFTVRDYIVFPSSAEQGKLFSCCLDALVHGPCGKLGVCSKGPVGWFPPL